MFWPCETKTSTCRNFAMISSGLYRFLAITVLLDVKDIPQVGLLQRGRITLNCAFTAPSAAVTYDRVRFASEGSNGAVNTLAIVPSPRRVTRSSSAGNSPDKTSTGPPTLSRAPATLAGRAYGTRQ